MSTTEPTTERERNLARWSEVEPERCRVKAYGYWLGKFRVVDRTRDEAEPGRNDDELLGALIEAIETREWHYMLDNPGGNCRAALWRRSKEPIQERPFTAIADTLADALLSAYVLAAYVAALEGKRR